LNFDNYPIKKDQWIILDVLFHSLMNITTLIMIHRNALL